MRNAFLKALLHLRDEIIPPRQTERLVRTLSLEDLAVLRQNLDTLPYSDERVRALVWELKYYAASHARELCGTYLAEILLDIRQELLDTPLLIPIPMHAKRRRERGHNHTEILAETALGHVPGLFTYEPNILSRHRYTPTQQGLPESKRNQNVIGSMQVNHPELVSGKICILIDDVRTTGATLDEARKVLIAAGAQDVFEVVLAQS